MKPIRNSAKAIIIDKHRVLLTVNRDEQGLFYLFPGGGQEKEEQLSEAVQRECREEIGCNVEVGDIVYIREYIGKNHQFAEWDHEVHQVEFYFECSLQVHTETFEGTNPDNNQVGVEWIDIDRLGEIRLYPFQLAERLRSKPEKPVYLGDTN